MEQMKQLLAFIADKFPQITSLLYVKKEAKQHSKKAQVYQANEGEAPGKKKSRLKFGEGESVKTEKTSVVKKAGSATSAALHREISKNEDDNAAVEGAHKLEESGEGVYRLEQRLSLIHISSV